MGCCCGHKKVIKNDFKKLEPKKPVEVEIDNTAEIQRQEAERKENLRLQKLKEEEEERKRKEEEARRKKEQEEREQREALERERERLRKLKEEEEIREADLLKTKAIEVNKGLEPPEPTEEEIDEKKFTDLMHKIRGIVPDYEKFQKDSFSRICTKSIENPNQNETFEKNRFGPQIKNKRICDIQEKEKYDFSQMIQAKSFIEYTDNDLILERLLEKPKHSVCSYLGKIKGKYCCVKLIPCVQLQEAKKWIEAVDNYQKKIENALFMKNFKFYFYYKLEDVQQTHFNIYIISNLEQYNAYTIATDKKITIEQKARVMYLSISILKSVIITKYQNENEQQLGQLKITESNKLLEQVKKNIYTVKNNNILITFTQKEQQVYLADWQLLIEEFQNIIPYTQIQSQDQQMQNILLEASNSLSQHSQSQSQTNQAKDQVEKFIKELLNLISFGVNDQLNQEVKLRYFISSGDFKKYSIKFLELENTEESDIQKSIILKIRDKDNTQYCNDKERKFLCEKSQMIIDKLSLNYKINYKPFLLFLIVQKLEYCEQMRPLLEKQIQNDFLEQHGQNNQQAR